MDVEDLIRTLRRTVREQEQQLARDKSFLAELEARARTVRLASVPSAERVGTPRIVEDSNEGSTPTLRRVSRPEKAERTQALIEGRLGRWTTVELRDALREQGIDPDAGTPVKNILYSFVNDDGWGSSHGGGVYEFSETRGEEGAEPETVRST